jgi:hypothetical protein
MIDSKDLEKWARGLTEDEKEHFMKRAYEALGRKVKYDDKHGDLIIQNERDRRKWNRIANLAKLDLINAPDADAAIKDLREGNIFFSYEDKGIYSVKNFKSKLPMEAINAECGSRFEYYIWIEVKS